MKMSGKMPHLLKAAKEAEFWETKPLRSDLVEHFVTIYENERELLQSCLEDMRKLLEERLLEHNLKCIVTGRVKAVDSLRRRLYEKTANVDPEHQNLLIRQLPKSFPSSNQGIPDAEDHTTQPLSESTKLPSDQTFTDPDSPWTFWGLMKWDFDIFGLRIALYFPEQRQEVLEMFDNEETAVFERKALESMKNGDVVYECVNERDGNDAKILRSPRVSADANGAATDLNSAVERRFRGYTEEIRYVSFKPEVSFKSGRRELPKPFRDLWIEIQVRSVIMDAYTNISHGLEYKALTEILSEEEIQVLESINGLAQTGEVLLQHLQHVHQQRLQSDLRSLDFKQIIDEVARYMDLESSSYPFSENSYYQRILQRFLSLIGYNRPGKLKKLLEFYKTKEEYPSKFLEFSASFSNRGSLEAWIFHKILQNITESRIDLLFARSDWCLYSSTFHLYIYVVLSRVYQSNTLDYPSQEPTEASYDGLATLFFLFVWSSRSCEPLDESKLLKTISRIIDMPENKVPFLVTLFFDILIERLNLEDNYESSYLDVSSVSRLLIRLAKRPRSLEKGLQVFLDHSERIIEATGMSSEGTGRSDVENSMSKFMLWNLRFPDFVDIAHENPHNPILDFMAEYMLLRGLDQLRQDKEVELQPWMEYQPAKWRHLSAPRSPRL